MITKLPFGLKNGILLSINDVERGLACDCICPSCKSKLIAKKGDSKIHHFAHYSVESCSTSIETALHLAAKEIIEKEKYFVIPPLKIENPNSNFEKISLFESRKISFTDVRLEVSLSDIKPDLIIYIGEKKLMIEIAVTHFVDKEKYEKIKLKNISTIEVDLKSLKDGFTYQDLKRMVLDSINNKEWIYNTKKNELENKYFNDYKEQLQYAEEQRKQEELTRTKHYNNEKAKEKERIKKAYKSGFDKISFNPFGDGYCPMTIKLSALKFQYNNIILKLREGKRWNGIIYGNGPNGKYIFLEKEKLEIFKRDKERNFNSNEDQVNKHLYGQLMAISNLAIINIDDCEKCQFFGEILTFNPLSSSCKFRKIKKLRE